MQNEGRKSHRTSRRSFTKSLLPAVLALQFAESAQVEAQQKKRKSPRQKQAPRQTSPITVGGGGGGRPGVRGLPYVSIHFDHCWYKKNNPKKPNQYWNPTDKLEKLWVTNENGATSEIQFTEMSVIVINCLRDSDKQNSELKVTAQPLGIEFDERDYPYNSATYVHASIERRIDTIYVDGELRFTAVDGRCHISIDDP